MKGFMEKFRKFLKIPNDFSVKGWHKISYIDWGNPNCDKVIFCVHGLSRNAQDFDYLALELQDKFRIIAIDIVGRGLSSWHEDKTMYNYANYVADCQYLLENLNISKVIWLGTSMGGIIAMQLFANNNNLIEKLILNDIGTFLPGKALTRVTSYVSKKQEFVNLYDAQKALATKLQTFGISNKEHMQYLYEISIVKNNFGKYVFNYDPEIIKTPNKSIELPDIDLEYLWKNINIPVLLLRGKKSDIFLKQNAEEMKMSKINIDLVEFDNVGHAPALMDKMQIKVIKDWLDGC